MAPARNGRNVTVRRARPNSALKLTVRRRLARRPSHLSHLIYARRRAACKGIIGVAASGAPLDAGHRRTARNLTSRRWDDTESEVASSSPARIDSLVIKQNIAFTVREPRAFQSQPETLKSHCRSRGVDQFTKHRSASLLLANTNQFTRHRSASIASVARSRRTSPFETRRLAKFLARGTSVNIALGSWDRSCRRRRCFVALLVHSPDRGVTCRASRFRLR